MKKFLSIAIVLFCTLTALAQDSTSSKPSPLFNPAKIKSFGDPFFPGHEGANDLLRYYYSQGDDNPIPGVIIFETPGSQSGNAAYYLGYDQQGTYLRDGNDGKYKRWDGEKLTTVQKVPEKLYNSAQEVLKANYESTHGVGSYEKSAKASTYTPPSNDPVSETPATVSFTPIGEDENRGFIKYNSGKDTTSYEVVRGMQFRDYPDNLGAYISVKPQKSGKYKLFNLGLKGDSGFTYGVSDVDPATATFFLEGTGVSVKQK